MQRWNVAITLTQHLLKFPSHQDRTHAANKARPTRLFRGYCRAGLNAARGALAPSAGLPTQNVQVMLGWRNDNKPVPHLMRVPAALKYYYNRDDGICRDRNENSEIRQARSQTIIA